jgi:ribose 5-phosphate isomerase B
MKKVFLASDHAGFELKEALIPFLTERGYEIDDLGPHTFDKNDDYPLTIGPLARAVADNKEALGIAIGLSGQGEAMEANRSAGVRAAEYYGGTMEVIKLAREHNNANVLSLGAKFISQQEAKDAVLLWLQTDFSNEERHARRVEELG